MTKITLFNASDGNVMLEPGEILFSQGDEGDLAYILVSGTAEICVNGAVVETADEGTLVGEMALADDHIRSATVRAVSSCKFVELSQKRLTFLVQEHPYFAILVIKIIAERLRHMNEVAKI